MNFNKIISLFIFVFLFLSTKSTFAIEVVGRLLSTLETQNNENAIKKNKREIWVSKDLFYKSFKARDLDKCLKSFTELEKIVSFENIIWPKFFILVKNSMTNAEDLRFFEEFTKEYEKQSKEFAEQEIEKACSEGDANKCVAYFKKIQKRFRGDYCLRMPNPEFHARVAALLSKEDDLDLFVSPPKDIKKLSDELHTKISKVDEEQKVNLDEILKEKRLQKYKKLSLSDLNRLLRKVIPSGNWKKIDALLRAGADKDYIDDQGFSMVHVAAFFGKCEVLEVLHNHGANLAVKTRDEGWNVLHLVHDSFENYNIYQEPAVKVVIFVLTHCKQLMTEVDKNGISPDCLFLQDHNLIGAFLKYNEIIDNNGAVLI